MSLFHVSIAAEHPEQVANFLGEILGGTVFPFPPFPGCWIAFTSADDGTAIEVYPSNLRLVAGPSTIECEIAEADRSKTFVHAAIASPLDRNEIVEAGVEQGWLTRICDRGPFQCVEIWLENRLLIEVLDPKLQADYRTGMTAENWARMFGFDQRR